MSFNQPPFIERSLPPGDRIEEYGSRPDETMAEALGKFSTAVVVTGVSAEKPIPEEEQPTEFWETDTGEKPPYYEEPSMPTEEHARIAREHIARIREELSNRSQEPRSED